LGTEPDSEEERRVAPDSLAEDSDLALARLQLTGDQLHERRLARAVRPEKAGDAWRHPPLSAIPPNPLPVPFAQMRCFHERRTGGGPATTSTPRIRRSRIRREPTI